MAFQVTKVNLPERTRTRLEAESNQQRVMKPHDIRGSIPLVDYTNPAKFPPYVFREYPKMPLLDGNRPITIDDSGGVLVFYDATDEADFMDLNPDVADEIERNTPARAMASAIAAKDSEIEDLRSRLRAAGIEDARKPRNDLAGVVRSSRASPTVKATGGTSPAQDGAVETTNDASSPSGLRETLPKTTDNPLKKKH